MQNFFVFSLVTLTFVWLSEGQSANNCNYYKKGSAYWAPGRCSIGGLFGLDTTTDQKAVCKNTTTMMLEKYPLGSNCVGTPNSTLVTSGSFKCDGVQCDVGYEYTPFTSPGQSYSFTSKNCVSTSPRKIIYGVPGYCAPSPNTFIFYCGSNNNSYVQTSCTSSTAATPFLEKNACYEDGVNQRRMVTCNGGPTPPNGVSGYKTANSYTSCNYFDVNGTVGVIDKCTGGLTVSYKAVCKNANTLQLSTYQGTQFCAGSPTSVNTYKQGDANVQFSCTGSQCLLERKISSTCSSAKMDGINYIVPGKCIKMGPLSGVWYKYYCYGTNNSQVFVERYSTSTCTKLSLNFASAKNLSLPSCEAGTNYTSCTLNGKTPPFAAGGSSHFWAMTKMVQVALGLCILAFL